jgi:hypothetical protein
MRSRAAADNWRFMRLPERSEACEPRIFTLLSCAITFSSCLSSPSARLRSVLNCSRTASRSAMHSPFRDLPHASEHTPSPCRGSARQITRSTRVNSNLGLLRAKSQILFRRKSRPGFRRGTPKARRPNERLRVIHLLTAVLTNYMKLLINLSYSLRLIRLTLTPRPTDHRSARSDRKPYPHFGPIRSTERELFAFCRPCVI